MDNGFIKNDLEENGNIIKILLVDDQLFIEKVVRKMIEDESDMNFCYCQQPDNAIDIANDFKPTVILQDLVMPKINGLDLVQCFRNNSITKKIPLIVLSTNEDAKIKAKAFSLGANDYMVKFPDKLEVIARIRYHSNAYINMLQRDDAYKKIEEHTSQLSYTNSKLRQEISERKKAEQALRSSQKRYRGLFDSSKDGIFLADTDYNILDANKAFINLLKYSLEELRSLNISEITPAKWHETEALILQNQIISKGYSQEYEKELICKDSSIIHVSNRIWFQKDQTNKIVGMWGLIRDISYKKRIEGLKEDVERMMRHDLKTPLNGIINLSNKILQKQNFPDNVQKHLEMINDSGNQILHMVEHSLDMFKMEEKTYVLEPVLCNLINIFKQIHEELKSQASQKSLDMIFLLNNRTVSWDEKYEIYGNYYHLKNLFSNLIKNSIEASPPDKNIIISIDKTKKWHVIIINNSGVIPYEIRDNFFDKYSTSEKKGGTGLGTYSAMLIAKTHQGTIEFKTSNEEGTTLFVKLPHKIEIKSKPPDINSQENNTIQENIQKTITDGSRILVVEDNNINQEVVKELLAPYGFIIDIQNNGIKAIEAVKNNKYDAVLMDMQMPEMDGFEATRIILQNQNNKNLPIIAMSAHSQEDEINKCIKAGMRDYLKKPINEYDLINILAKWIKNKNIKLKNIEKNQKNIVLEEKYNNLSNINIKKTLRMLGGNKNLLQKMMNQFINDFNNVDQNIRDYINNNEVEKAFRMAHTLKGIANQLGAESVFTISEKIEKNLKNNIVKNIEILLLKLKNNLVPVFNSINQYLKSETKEEILNVQKIDHIDEIIPEIQKIAIMLKDYDSEVIDYKNNIELQLNELISNPEILNLWKIFSSQIAAYNFDKAYKTLISFADSLNFKIE